MNTNRFPPILLAGALLCPLNAECRQSPAPAPNPIELRILYVGHPQTPREKDFTEFLEKHFAKVGKGDLDKFRETDAEGYDVVILDYSGLVIKGNAIDCPDPPFSDTYARPTVTVGATGALVCDRMRLKTGYL